MEATNRALRLRIQKCFVQILRDLQPLKVVHELYQEEIFDLDDMEEVEVEKTRKKQAKKLVKMILQSGRERAMPAFVKSLQNSHPRLAQLLHESVSGENASCEYLILFIYFLSDLICCTRLTILGSRDLYSRTLA